MVDSALVKNRTPEEGMRGDAPKAAPTADPVMSEQHEELREFFGEEALRLNVQRWFPSPGASSNADPLKDPLKELPSRM